MQGQGQGNSMTGAASFQPMMQQHPLYQQAAPGMMYPSQLQQQPMMGLNMGQMGVAPNYMQQ